MRIISKSTEDFKWSTVSHANKCVADLQVHFLFCGITSLQLAVSG